ncbi:thioredoxin domain-containing protein [Kitasatospora purpeofusca]|uniref:hypothetical protein n=1 Tax=Kitasatospora purpeofusca TaxID=67352 RepID=UPI003654BA50
MAPYSEGRQYSTLKQAVPGQPQVVRFFSFFEPHSYQFDLWDVDSAISQSLPAGTQAVAYHVDFMGGDFASVLSQA